MPRNPLLGVEAEEEEKKGTDPDADEPKLEDAEDEESDEDEDELDEDEDEEPVPAPKPKKGAKKRQPSQAPVNPAMSVGTLGDAKIDTTTPVSEKGRTYWAMLLESPLVPSIIPSDILNDEENHVFCINSLRLIVPKGKIVQVPLMLAQEIAQSFKQRI